MDVSMYGENREAGAKGMFALLTALGGKVRCGSIDLHLPNGAHYRFVGSEPGANAEITVHNRRFVRRLLLRGHNGFADSYLDGDFSTPDLTALLTFGAANEAAWERVIEGRPLFRLLQRVPHLLRPNSRRGSRRNVMRHYDLGNEFYAAWLDPGMTYSSALFERPAESLEQAQDNKYRSIAEMARLHPDHHVLEIGCGWGGFASFAAREIGCRVTAVTISEAQHAYASRRIQAEGLNEKVKIRRQDYRDLQGRYDRVTSIEMLEAVGERYWPVYFAKLRDRLTPGGAAALQVITIADAAFESYRRGADFIQRHIFPGGLLPAPSALHRETERADLRWTRERDFGLDYARTLAAWREAFVRAWPRISTMGFDERFRRLWTYYLSYCEAGFLVGRIDVKQLALVRD